MFLISADTAGTFVLTQKEKSIIYKYNSEQYIASVYDQHGMWVALRNVMRRYWMFLYPSWSKLVNHT